MWRTTRVQYGAVKTLISAMAALFAFLALTSSSVVAATDAHSRTNRATPRAATRVVKPPTKPALPPISKTAGLSSMPRPSPIMNPREPPNFTTGRGKSFHLTKWRGSNSKWRLTLGQITGTAWQQCQPVPEALPTLCSPCPFPTRSLRAMFHLGSPRRQFFGSYLTKTV
jgi:hypothetical protein